MFLPLADWYRAMEIANTIRVSAESNGRVIAGKEIGLTLSIGVASSAHQPGLAALLQEADRQLYRAKTSGRNRVCSSKPAAPHADTGHHRHISMREVQTTTPLAASE